MNLAKWLIKSASLYPEKQALLKGTKCCANYKTFNDRAASISYYLNNINKIVKGDRVAIFMPNSTEYLEIIYAVWYLGGVVVPINSKLHIDEAIWIIKDSGAKVVFTDDDKQFEPSVENHLNLLVISVLNPNYKNLYLLNSKVKQK